MKEELVKMEEKSVAASECKLKIFEVKDGENIFLNIIKFLTLSDTMRRVYPIS
jgi:hypothetical protein